MLQNAPIRIFSDFEANQDTLPYKIQYKTIPVIAGAGFIGSSFIKVIIPFKPRILVVDINENEFAELTRGLRSTKGGYGPEDYITYSMDVSHCF